jgi:molybdopterin-guanine dinucleotide biosynthesis protein A
LSLLHPDPAGVADAFILAGGRSSRMGHDKALIPFNGMPLIQHVINVYRSAGLSPRIAGTRSDLSAFAPVIADDPTHPGRGPLSGISAALEAATAPLAIFLPVDLPLLATSLITYLLHYAQISGSAITVVSIGAFIETFPVVIDREAAPSLRTSLASGDRKCLTAFQAAAAELGKPFSVLPVENLFQAGKVAHPHGLPPHAWFLSINDPANLASAEALLKRHLQLS